MESKTYVYKREKNYQIKADFYKASNSKNVNPLIIFIHGGALIYGTRKTFSDKEFQLQLYLRNGFDVLSIDYRLAPETKLPEIIKDIQDAYMWVIDNAHMINIDKKSISVIGHSAGGYLALMCGFILKSRPKSIVSFYGYGDIIGKWYSKPDSFYCKKPKVSIEESGINISGPVITDRPFEGTPKDKFYLYLRQNGLWPKEVGGHDPTEERDFFIPFCPLYNVNPEYPPTLLLHGDSDTDVPYKQSELMYEEFKRNNIFSKLITIEDGEHEFDININSKKVLRSFKEVLSFLKNN
jgi:acetyl esterase/lipase